MQLVGGVEVLAAGEVTAVHQINQVRVGPQELPGAGVARSGFRGFWAKSGIEQQRMSRCSFPSASP